MYGIEDIVFDWNILWSVWNVIYSILDTSDIFVGIFGDETIAGDNCTYYD